MDFIESKTLKELGEELKKRLDNIAKINTECTGILSGFYSLDAITKGFQPSNLVMIAGVEGIGKTAFAISLIRKMAIENHCRIAFFSFGMTSQQLLLLLIRQQTKIASEKLRLGLLNDDERELVAIATAATEEAPLNIVDYPFLTVSDIEDFFLCSPPDFAEIIIIDSLQFIAKSKKDQVGKILNKREMTQITFQLKKLAEKLNITILVLVRYDLPIRGYRTHYIQRPYLSDLRTYAPIDTYADLILLLYRPEYYKMEEWDDDEGLPAAGEAEIIVAKNTNGILENARLQFIGSLGKFDNLSSINDPDNDLPF